MAKGIVFGKEAEAGGHTGASIIEQYAMSANAWTLYQSKYWDYRGHDYSHEEAKRMSLDYLRSVHLIV